MEGQGVLFIHIQDFVGRLNTNEKYKNSQKKLAKKQSAMDVLQLIVLHNNGNVDKKFQPSILNSS